MGLAVDPATARSFLAQAGSRELSDQELDRVAGGKGSSTISLNYLGDDNENNVRGDAMDNVMDGKGGDDCLAGEGGNDFLLGGEGCDILYGGAGEDKLFGGLGQGHPPRRRGQ